ncbi:MAG: SpoIIE family protein phosphatase, partial [Acidimicrobiia bacterium]
FEAVITDEGPGFDAPPPTPSGLGVGLAGAGRLMDQLLIETLPGGGRVTTSKRLPASGSIDHRTDRWWVEVVSRPRIGNSVSGDRWWAQNGGASLLLAVVDGLGSGPGAAQASTEVVESLSGQDADRPLHELMEGSHRSAAPTRGAVALLARLRSEEETLEYVSVGDVAGRVEPSGERLVPTPGVLGVELPRLEVARIPWSAESRLSLWTDGIAPSDESRFDGPDDRDRRGDWIETVTREHGIERDDCLLLTAGETGRSS